MIVGTLFLKMGAALFYGPEFPRGGLAATFSGEVLGEIGASALEIVVEHRNREDTTWLTAVSVATVSGVGVFDNSFSGLREILRYKYNFTSGSDGEGFRVLMAPASWRPW
jgi:hypothetical protein